MRKDIFMTVGLIKKIIIVLLLLFIVGCVTPTEPSKVKVSRLRQSGERGS